MAIWFADNSKTYGVQAELKADGASDVANLPDFATAHDLKPGTTCLVQGESEVYAMNSDDTWVKL